MKRALVLGAVLSLIGLFLLLDLGRYFSLEEFAQQQAAIEAFRSDNPLLTAGVYFGVYVLVTALSLPGAAFMTLIGGAIFGFLWGTVLVSFASTIGATLAFLLARFLFRDVVRRRFGSSLERIDEGVRRDGALYLFMLRLVPLFPFFVINLAMALTPMRALTFLGVSQVGMLPGTMVYVNAGTQIAQIETAAGILSPSLLAAFALLGIFPFVARWIVQGIQRRRVLRGWPKPARFERNLVVIGAGAAGLVTAYIAAAVKAKVTLIEKDAMGGDCLNTGCVPSKALIRSAGFMAQLRRHEEYGIREASAEVDFADLMARVRRVVATIEPHDSVERYERLGVEVLEGDARITGPWTVQVGDRTLTTRHIVVASGARPQIPPCPGLDAVGFYTSETIWTLTEHPGRLLVLGGGPVGCELAQSFQRLGAQVTLLERLPRLLPIEDEEVSELVAARLRSEGVDVRTGHEAVAFELRDGEKTVVARCLEDPDTGTERLTFETLLVAVGREARVEGFGLEEVGVTLRDGRIETDEALRTRVPTIHACGDCVGPYLYTHAASHQAWHAAVNSLFSNPFHRFRVDYTAMPHVIFTDPEVARVGLSEAEARERGVSFEVTRYDLGELDRAITDEAAYGFVKVLTAPGKDRILGATVVGEAAGELIAQLTLALKHGIGLNKILGTIHSYPTLSEANKFVAGAWKRAHTGPRVLAMLERVHQWRRG